MVKNLTQAQVINTAVHSDSRGYFAESWNNNWKLDIDLTVKQTNICWTEHRNTLRGFHAQHGTAEVAKLVRVIKGEILDVFVDARRDSQDYGVFRGVKLSSVDSAVYIPRGFYHGYVTLTDDVLVTYHQDAVYDGTQECGVNYLEAGNLFWESWLINPADLVVSDKDRAQPAWQYAVKF